MIDVHRNSDGGNFILVAWLTSGEDTASVRRWMTAHGNFEGSSATIDVYDTKDGSFDDPQAVNSDSIGTMTIYFSDCNSALLTYLFTTEKLSNSIEITGAIPGSQAMCEELAVTN